jgi:hypothetical protein
MGNAGNSGVDYLLGEKKRLDEWSEKFSDLQKMYEGKMTTSEVLDVLLQIMKDVNKTYSADVNLTNTLKKAFLILFDKKSEEMKALRKEIVSDINVNKRKRPASTTGDGDASEKGAKVAKSDSKSETKSDKDSSSSSTRGGRRAASSTAAAKSKNIELSMRLEFNYDDENKCLCVLLHDNNTVGGSDLLKPGSIILCGSRTIRGKSALSETLLVASVKKMKATIEMSKESLAKDYKNSVVYIMGSTGPLRHVPLCFQINTSLADLCTENPNGTFTSVFANHSLAAVPGSDGTVNTTTSVTFSQARARKEYGDLIATLHDKFAASSEVPKAKDYDRYISDWADFLNDDLVKNST